MASIELTASPFSKEHLFAALTNAHASLSEVAGRPHPEYLFGYLSKLGAGTIIVESPYTDADYLDDFTSYYARCFIPFLPTCKRLHFFTGQHALNVTEGISSGTLAREEVERLKSEYLGFVVARRLDTSYS